MLLPDKRPSLGTPLCWFFFSSCSVRICSCFIHLDHSEEKPHVQTPKSLLHQVCGSELPCWVPPACPGSLPCVCFWGQPCHPLWLGRGGRGWRMYIDVSSLAELNVHLQCSEILDLAVSRAYGFQSMQLWHQNCPSVNFRGRNRTVKGWDHPCVAMKAFFKKKNYVFSCSHM